MTYFYEIFGFNVQSMIELPTKKMCIDKIGFLTADVHIELGDVQYKKNDLDLYFDIQFDEQSTTFSIKETATFQISGGNRIKIDICEDADNETVLLYLFGSAFGFLMHQKSCFPLHGSAAVIDDSCVVLVGHSGAGKSSLSGGFIKDGYKLLTDDVARYELMEDQFTVFHSYPSQKLWKDTIAHLEIDDTNKLRLLDRMDKYSLRQTDSFEIKPKQLKAIIEIVPKEVDAVQILKLNKIESLSTLIMHTYRFEYFNEYENIALKHAHFKSVANLVKEIPVFRLFRPKNSFTVDEQVKLIIQTIGGL